MLEVRSQENLPKKLHIFIATISQIIIFIADIDFEKQNNLFITWVPNLERYYGNLSQYFIFMSRLGKQLKHSILDVIGEHG